MITLVEFYSGQLALAREAFYRFGKGRHRAGLNFGDCFSYALSKAAGEPLLYKGVNFAKTDVVSALAIET
jgi:ribonuclease VapC